MLIVWVDLSTGKHRKGEPGERVKGAVSKGAAFNTSKRKRKGSSAGQSAKGKGTGGKKGKK